MINKTQLFKWLSIIFCVACVCLMAIYVYDKNTDTAVWGITSFLLAVIFSIFHSLNKNKSKQPQSCLLYTSPSPRD